MTITFDGTASTAFNALCFRVQTDNASVRQYDTTVVLGKNGNALFDRKRFPNETNVYYVVFPGEDAESNYSAFKNFVLSREGYKRLEDSEHPYEFYMAYVSEPIDPTVTRERDMIKCVVTFSRLPQRFLKSGEIPLTITQSTHTVTNDVVVIDNSAGDKVITNLSAAISPIQDLNGYDHPWPAGGGKNKVDFDDVAISNSGQLQVSLGVITLPAGTYTFSYSLNKTVTATLNRPMYTPLGGNSVYGDDLKTAGRGSWIFTIESEITVEMKWWYHTVSEECEISDFQLELGSTATAYTPYSNICPISGRTGLNVWRTGKNLLDPSLLQVFNSKKYIRTVSYATQGTVKVQGDTSYALSRKSAMADGKIYYYDAFGNPISDAIISSTNPYYFTTPPNCATIGFYVAVDSIGSLNSPQDAEPQLELGSTATAYEPYNGNTYAVDWTSEAGTVYGGTLDVTQGVLTVNKMMFSANTSTMDNAEDFPGWKSSGVKANNPVSGAQANALTNVGKGCSINTNGSNDIIFLPKTYYNGMTQSEWIALAQDVQIVYELATPITYQLTQQEVEALLGTNNIWADAGDVTVTYVEATTFENPTYFSANPIIRLYGVGTLTLNGNQITITNADVYTDIDFETGECYKGDIDKNQYVSLSTPDFVPLKAGTNVVLMSGITKIDVTPRWWQK